MNTLLINPETGEFEKRDASENIVAPPRRAWKRNGEAGKYDFSFVDSDKATIYATYPTDFDSLETRRDELIEASQVLSEKGRAFAALQKDPDNEVPPAQMRELEKKLRGESQAVAATQNQLAQDIVNACVIGWKDAPIPFSEQNRDELPFDICVEWMQKILERSELSGAESRLFKTSLVGSSKAKESG